METPNILRAEAAILAIGRNTCVSVQEYDGKLLWTVNRDSGRPTFGYGQGDSLAEAIEAFRIVKTDPVLDVAHIEREAA
jgi:hypothetical protein